MYSLNKIYEGQLKNQGSESFRFTIKDFKKVHGAFCSGGANLSLAFDNGKKVVLQGFEFSHSLDCPPNKRPIFFEQAIEMELISGVITGQPSADSSVYLIME